MPRKNKILFVSAMMVCLALLMLARIMFLEYAIAQENLAAFVSAKPAVLDGVIVSDPDIRSTTVHINISVEKINGAPARGTSLAFLPPHTNAAYGEKVEVKGVVELPESFVGDAGNEFDYPGYLRVQGVSALVVGAHLQSVQPALWSLTGALYSLKHFFNTAIDRMLPKPDSALLEGMLLGERRGLSAALTQAFVVAGLIHIVILSGYSMSIVAEAVLRAGSFLPRRMNYFLGGALMILFVVMTGAAVTTIRACAMALIALIARIFHRRAIALRALGAAAFGMLLWNPLIISDASFIISVIATFGLITISPWVENKLHFITEKYEARAIATSTLSVQIFVLPALLYFTGNLSFFALPANLLVLPILPFALFAGFIAGIASCINSFLAYIPALIADAFLRYILFIVHLINNIPYSAVTIISFPFWAAVACYIPLTLWAISIYRKNLVMQEK
jgi:competence protein ComEC